MNGIMNGSNSPPIDSIIQSKALKKSKPQTERISPQDKTDNVSNKNFGPISTDFFLVSESGSDSSLSINGSCNELVSSPQTATSNHIIPSSPVFRLNRNKPNSTSSIEAFEASFDTAFPSTFDSTPTDEPPSLSLAFDLPEFS